MKCGRTINEQLNIGVPNRNVNIKSRYVRGMNKSQVQLGTEDWALDFYNDSQALNNMSNMDGGSEEYSNLWGRMQCRSNCKDMFPSDKLAEKTCDKMCKRCDRKNKCGTKGNNPFPTKGEVCASVGSLSDSCASSGLGNGAGDGSGNGEGGNSASNSGGISTGAIIGVVAGVAALGVTIYFLTKRRG